MSRGRKPTPTVVKLNTGNPGKRPLNTNEPEPKKCIPDMPKWIEPFALAVENWQRESKILDGIGVLTEADAEVLATRCYLYHQMVELANDVQKEGTTIDGQRHNPKQKQLESIIKEHRTFGSLLGLDPSSRSKISTIRKQQTNEWDDF